LHMHGFRTFVINHLWWAVLIVAAAMLAAHGFGVHTFVVDNTSLILLFVILISPFVSAIRRIKIGDFEAEIDPEEVKQVARQAERAVPEPPTREGSGPKGLDVGAAIRNLAETDPVVALAKLRIEIESLLRRLHQRTNHGTPLARTAAPLSLLIRDLVSAEVIYPDMGAALRSVIAICNRAIHGEDIREVDAKKIIDSGIDLVEELGRTFASYATTFPVEEANITSAEYDQIQNARYRLTTVIPIVNKPVRHVYLLTQDELDSFFDGYSDFAEFVVGLEMLPGAPPLTSHP